MVLQRPGVISVCVRRPADGARRQEAAPGYVHLRQRSPLPWITLAFARLAAVEDERRASPFRRHDVTDRRISRKGPPSRWPG